MLQFSAENHVTVEVDQRTLIIRSIDNPRIQMIAVLEPEMMREIAASLKVASEAAEKAKKE